MIPTEDQLRTISQMRSGDLEEIPFAVLLHAMSAAGRSGALEIEQKPKRKEILFRDGVPIECRSNLLHETLGRFLVANGQLQPDREQELLGKAAASGTRFGEVLLAEGLINASELYRVLQQNLARKLLDGFTWRRGTFKMSQTLPDVASPLKVKAPQLVLTGIVKLTPDEEINAAVGPLVGKRLCLHPDPPHPPEALRLGRAQRRVIELIESGKRLDELAAEASIPFDQIMRLVYSLAILGVVVPEDRMPKVVKATRSEATDFPVTRSLPEDVLARARSSTPPPARPERPASQAPRATSDEDRDAVMTAYLRYLHQDPYELFDLEESASNIAVRRAYLAYSERFAPWRFQGELREKAEDLFVAGGEAYGTLADVERRNAVLTRRKVLRDERKARPAADRFAIRSDLLDPQVQFDKGKALKRAGKHREAVKQLEFAHDMDAQNCEYRAELAHTRFLAWPESDGDRAIDELRETLRIDPKCGLALLYRGQIETELGRFADAEEHLRKAIKLLAPDRRPIEALKDMQARSKPKRGLFR